MRSLLSPHRAILALGTIFMVMAIAGASLAIANATRAERGAANLTGHFLVLAAPEQAMQESVTAFQVVAERSFAATAGDAAFLPSAVVYSTATDQAYVVLRRLLALPVNDHLAPGLEQVETAYVGARTGLSAFLADPMSAAAADAAVAEQSAYKSLDASLASLASAVAQGSLVAARGARAASEDARESLLWSLAVGLAIGIAITAALGRRLVRAERRSAEREAAQSALNRGVEFEGRLQRALEMARAEVPVYELVGQALDETARGTRSELLLADSSRAHFRQVLVSPSNGDRPGCGVVSPGDCPAASRGQTMVFPSSAALDVCPNLRGRACSAVCVPVSVSGSAIGVIHVMAHEGSPPPAGVRRDLEVIARRASERLAMLRAFEASQTQANSDSLTGLLTRRSLENRVRELQETGVSYSVAYCDLDQFKQLNDVFGHDAGDRSLRAFAQVLRDALRPSDIPCRYGGEEFVVILPSCPVYEAVPVLERVRRCIALRLTSGHLPAFTVSCGIASSDQAPDFEQVVAMADAALLQAKAGGRDRVVVAGDVATGDLANSDGSVTVAEDAMTAPPSVVGPAAPSAAGRGPRAGVAIPTTLTARP